MLHLFRWRKTDTNKIQQTKKPQNPAKNAQKPHTETKPTQPYYT